MSKHSPVALLHGRATYEARQNAACVVVTPATPERERPCLEWVQADGAALLHLIKQQFDVCCSLQKLTSQQTFGFRVPRQEPWTATQYCLYHVALQSHCSLLARPLFLALQRVVLASTQ